eukprot:SAG11_NODE_3114_length_2677_cov_1.685415_4_plen_106_part_00
MSKAGIIRLTKSMAVDLGHHRIRYNAVLPGWMDTDHVFGTAAPAVGSDNRDDVGGGNPPALQRKGTPEDIGRAMAFLASDAAANITGIELPCDGGMLAWGGGARM